MTAVLLSSLLLVPSAEPGTVVASYLDALAALDQNRMDSYCAPDIAWIGADGSERKVDAKSRRDMRDFEREMRTTWTYRILSVESGRVTAELFEQNDFYDLLGVGPRSQDEVYAVEGGLIRRMETRDVHHEHGDFQAEYARFKKWLLSTPAAKDPDLVHDGGLLFDAKSAKPMRRWLEKWSRGQS